MDRAAERKRAIKGDDAWFATFVAAPIANRLLGVVADTRITPNQVTFASLSSAVAAAASFATGHPIGFAAGAALIQIAFVLDCLDGQLARHRGQTSAFGGWLDLMGDYLQDIVLFAGIAWGWHRQFGGIAPFLWGYAAILVVYYRHFDSVFLARTLGEGYVTLLRDPSRERDEGGKVRAIEEARRRAEGRWGMLERGLDRLAPKGTHERSPVVFWTKRAMLFSGGERYAVVSILALAGRVEWILPVIVGWGVIVFPLISARRWSLFGER